MDEKVKWTEDQELIYHLDDEGRVIKKEDSQSGEILEEIRYSENTTIVSKTDGTEVRKYFEDGHLVKKEKYKNGILKKIAIYTPNDDHTVFKRITVFK